MKKIRICKILMCSTLIFFPYLFCFFTSNPDTVIANGEDTTSSEEEREDQNISVNVAPQVTDSVTLSSCHVAVTDSGLLSGQMHGQLTCSMNGSNSYHSDEEDDDDGGDGDDGNENVRDAVEAGDNSVPTIYFSHTVEPKRVCILSTLLILHII